VFLVAAMKWFKHWNESSQGDTLRQFLVERDYECYALFWVLCEMASRMGSDGTFSVKRSFLANEMGMKPSKACRVLARFVLVSQSWNWHETGEIWTFRCTNWARFNDSRSKVKSTNVADFSGDEEKRRRREEENKDIQIRNHKKVVAFSPPDSESKNSDRCGAIPNLANDSDVQKILENINHKTQNLWIKTYGDTKWIEQEILKAITWLELNPTRKPKGKNHARFLGNWFSRGWEKHRKTLVSKQPSTYKGIAELLAEEERQNASA
jgi:hypothetical protein